MKKEKNVIPRSVTSQFVKNKSGCVSRDNLSVAGHAWAVVLLLLFVLTNSFGSHGVWPCGETERALRGGYHVPIKLRHALWGQYRLESETCPRFHLGGHAPSRRSKMRLPAGWTLHVGWRCREHLVYVRATLRRGRRCAQRSALRYPTALHYVLPPHVDAVTSLKRRLPL